MSVIVDPQTPVLIGFGCVAQRVEDPTTAREPIDLMIAAAFAASVDSGAQKALAGVDRIAVPKGRWTYRNPAGAIARAVSAATATTVSSSVGVLQQTLIGDACEAISNGKISSALVVGGDAGYRLLRAKQVGAGLVDQDQDDDPDTVIEPVADLRHPAELSAGFAMPVGLYALIDGARRAASGQTINFHRNRLAAMYARFSEVAANNPHAWNREALAAEFIRDAAPTNPMQAFPYTRSHCSAWNVDQAAALFLCSAKRAEALGIERSRWVFPVASVESNHMVPVAARADLARSPGAEETARVALELAASGGVDLDLTELYSCFPVAVDLFADALAKSAADALTVTGSMAFAGGPYNNYFFQATCRVAELLRGGQGRGALLSCVSGAMTKQAVALWSATPGNGGFVRRDVTDAVAAQSVARPVREQFSGDAQVVATTVLYDRGTAPRATALVDTSDARAFASSDDPRIVASFERDEWIGRVVRVSDNRLVA